eukprot:TRINITY_DN1074_c1_g1_i10.p1 TRINITY_DN1074_c1_g1~~TRINITY_DN1074_c1_g1_i10.p1  ORF type:complete len:431 (-),score=75.27 TRINITY_DN1074_c1_g1_i10:1788-3080(-)
MPFTKPVRLISAGGSHVAFIVRNDDRKVDELYVCGEGEKGQLGLGSPPFTQQLPNVNTTFVTKPMLVTTFSDPVKSISMGWETSSLVTEGGELWMWGCNNRTLSSSSLLIPLDCNNEEIPKYVYEPTRVHYDKELNDKEDKITTLSLSMNHCLASTEKGRVLAWGDNKYGQLGVMQEGESNTKAKPKFIRRKENNNKETSIQSPSTTRTSKSIVIIKSLEGSFIVKVSTGVRHSMALDSTGSVYLWGSGKNGQLGISEESNINNDLIIRIPYKLQFQSILQCKEHQDNRDDDEDSGGSSRMLSKFDDIESGWNFSIVRAGSRIYSFGRNNFGQLGIGGRTDQFLPNMIRFGVDDDIDHKNDQIKISCGSEHTLVIKGRKLYSFGWGEHGQLGHGNEEDQHTPTPIKLDSVTASDCVAGGGVSIITTMEPL